MVVFNELRINGDRDKLLIDVSIEPINVYDEVYISEIQLYHYKNADNTGEPKDPSKVITLYDAEVSGQQLRDIRKCVREADISTGVLGTATFLNEIFYVKVICDGTLPAVTAQYACGTDDMVDIGVVIDWKTLYELGMNFVANVNVCEDACKSKAGFEQFILTWFGIKLALSACDYEQLAKLWERFLRLTFSKDWNIGGGCGCGKI